MSKKTFDRGTTVKGLHGKRVISVVSFQIGEGYDVVEYDNAGAEKHKIAQIPATIDWDRLDAKEQAGLMASILEMYDERLQNPAMGIRAKPITAEQVAKLYTKISVLVTANPTKH